MPDRFSIDWPPRFQSRTGDPKDPCYIGKTANLSHAPSEESVKKLSEFTAGRGRYNPRGMMVKRSAR